MKPIYIPGFIQNADELFEGLWNNLAWERRSDAPRREYWTNVFDRDYSYGRGAGLRTYHAQPVTGEIGFVSEALNQDPRVKTLFEGCFLNGYEDAHDWLGWHEDDDPGIDHSKPIAVVTLYGGEGSNKPRSIQFREKLGYIGTGRYEGHRELQVMTYGPVIDQPLEHGSLCLMPAGFQATHQHRIPKAGFEAKSRISLTFRSLL